MENFYPFLPRVGQAPSSSPSLVAPSEPLRAAGAVIHWDSLASGFPVVRAVVKMQQQPLPLWLCPSQCPVATQKLRDGG
jgi:hypothetical protein